VPGASGNRRLFGVAAAIAIAVAIGLVFLLAGGDDDEPTSSRPSATQPEPTTQERPATTETRPTAKRPRPSNRDAATVQRVLTRLVQANEQGDGATVCQLLGKPAAGTGIDAADRCASSAGVDLALLPTSDELSVSGIHVKGDRATGSPSPGTTVSLRRSGRAWTVTGITR
jgi:hypothetical protein